MRVIKFYAYPVKIFRNISPYRQINFKIYKMLFHDFTLS